MITGETALDTAIGAIRAGAYDYVVKPINGDAIAASVMRALEHVTLKKELTDLRSEVRESARVMGSPARAARLARQSSRSTKRGPTSGFAAR